MVLEAEILIVGDELLAGEIADRNGPYLAASLAEYGLRICELRVLPDDAGVVADAVRTGLARRDAVFVAGGLGPTSDDVTSEAIAAALNLPLVLDPESWARIRRRFARRGIEPPPGNEKQAMFPAGALFLPNEHGTAPGYVACAQGRGSGFVAALPGPPRENRPMFEAALAPWLVARLPDAVRPITRVLRTFGLPESEVGHRLRAAEARHPAVRFGYQFLFPEILVKLRADSTASAGLDAAEAEVRAALAPQLYGAGEAQLPQVLGLALAARGLQLVTAESCTGGLAAKLLTDTAGSSAWLERGFVTYTNEAKQELLGVPAELLTTQGAVSEPVALAMLEGALARSRAQLGLAITGIAGPSGGTPEKPVGTVCIAWGGPGRGQVRTYSFPWDREGNRRISAWTAFHRLLRLVTEAGAAPTRAEVQ